MADSTTLLTIAFLEAQLVQMEEMQRDLLDQQRKILQYIQALQGKLAKLRANKAEGETRGEAEGETESEASGGDASDQS